MDIYYTVRRVKLCYAAPLEHHDNMSHFSETCFEHCDSYLNLYEPVDEYGSHVRVQFLASEYQSVL